MLNQLNHRKWQHDAIVEFHVRIPITHHSPRLCALIPFSNDKNVPADWASGWMVHKKMRVYMSCILVAGHLLILCIYTCIVKRRLCSSLIKWVYCMCISRTMCCVAMFRFSASLSKLVSSQYWKYPDGRNSYILKSIWIVSRDVIHTPSLKVFLGVGRVEGEGAISAAHYVSVMDVNSFISAVVFGAFFMFLRSFSSYVTCRLANAFATTDSFPG